MIKVAQVSKHTSFLHSLNLEKIESCFARKREINFFTSRLRNFGGLSVRKSVHNFNSAKLLLADKVDGTARSFRCCNTIKAVRKFLIFTMLVNYYLKIWRCCSQMNLTVFDKTFIFMH